MENTSTALIIASSMIIAMLLIALMVYSFQTVSGFAQKQVIEEDVSKVMQFNQPFLELESRATHDFSGKIKEVPIGATAEDVLSIINHTNHINKTTEFRVDFTIILNGKSIKAEDFDPKEQQEFIQNDLEEREKDINNPRLKYTCKLEYDNSGVAPRVSTVLVTIKDR